MSAGHEFLYEFGPYVLRGRERVLTRHGEVVSLAPKALDTLLVLLSNSGRLVAKEQLMSEVWPSTYVEEANLTQNISILRKVLDEGDDGSSYIETLPRRGYRFVAAVRRLPDLGVADRADGALQSGVQAERTYRFLAILPFENASYDEQMEYLSDGITESIINSLSQLPQLRVMSRNSVFRFKGKEMDARRVGRELGVEAVLLGRVHLLENRLLIKAELVDATTGWQLWGQNYDRGSGAILEIQDEIAKQISATLRLRLTGDEEQRLTKRYTESAEAYQSYLQGRHHWSSFTRESLEQATVYFRQAINLDPNYALAHAGIVDCYLRLATNYIPPAETKTNTLDEKPLSVEAATEENEDPLSPVKTRYRWDWTGVERELKRAAELKSSYPAAHQWQAAYLFSLNLFRETLTVEDQTQTQPSHDVLREDSGLESRSATPTPNEKVQVFCTIVREQLEVGNYEAAYAAMRQWWNFGEWPKLDGLTSYAAADLLFTAGSLAGCVTSSRQVPIGQKEAESLLNGAIGIFEHLEAKSRSAEGKIELACCYYRQGLFDLARVVLDAVLTGLTPGDRELRTLCLIRLAVIERHAGRLHESLARLCEASEMAELTGPWATGRYYQELGSTLKDLAAMEDNESYFERALTNYQKALTEFEAVGNHRYAAAVENNHGFLLLTLGDFESARDHLLRARALFEALSDEVRRAQVDETLARLHLAIGDFSSAEEAISRAVAVFEAGDEEALLAEALTTKGLVLSKLGRQSEAKGALESAYRVAQRCGYHEGAGRALLVVWQEMSRRLESLEKVELGERIVRLLDKFQETATRERLLRCLDLISKKKS